MLRKLMTELKLYINESLPEQFSTKSINIDRLTVLVLLKKRCTGLIQKVAQITKAKQPEFEVYLLKRFRKLELPPKWKFKYSNIKLK